MIVTMMMREMWFRSLGTVVSGGSGSEKLTGHVKR